MHFKRAMLSLNALYCTAILTAPQAAILSKRNNNTESRPTTWSIRSIGTQVRQSLLPQTPREKWLAKAHTEEKEAYKKLLAGLKAKKLRTWILQLKIHNQEHKKHEEISQELDKVANSNNNGVLWMHSTLKKYRPGYKGTITMYSPKTSNNNWYNGKVLGKIAGCSYSYGPGIILLREDFQVTGVLLHEYSHITHKDSAQGTLVTTLLEEKLKKGEIADHHENLSTWHKAVERRADIEAAVTSPEIADEMAITILRKGGGGSYHDPKEIRAAIFRSIAHDLRCDSKFQQAIDKYESEHATLEQLAALAS